MRRQVLAHGQPGTSAPQPKPFGPICGPRDRQLQAGCPPAACGCSGERAPGEDGGWVWQPSRRVGTVPVCRVGAAKFISAWMLLPRPRQKPGASVFWGAASRSCGLGGDFWQGQRVPWLGGQQREEPGGVSGACAPVQNVLLRAPTGKPTSSPERRSLFGSFFFGNDFSLPSSRQLLLAADGFPSPRAPLPAAAPKSPRAARPDPQAAGGRSFKTLRDSRAEQKAGSWGIFQENLRWEEREHCWVFIFLLYPAAIPLVCAASNEVFTELEEGTANKMFLRL